MTEKSPEFQSQYEDALRVLESEDTEIFTLVASDEEGNMSAVFANNTAVEKEVGHIELIGLAVEAMAEETGQSVSEILSVLESGF